MEWRCSVVAPARTNAGYANPLSFTPFPALDNQYTLSREIIVEAGVSLPSCDMYSISPATKTRPTSVWRLFEVLRVFASPFTPGPMSVELPRRLPLPPARITIQMARFYMVLRISGTLSVFDNNVLSLGNSVAFALRIDFRHVRFMVDRCF